MIVCIDDIGYTQKPSQIALLRYQSIDCKSRRAWRRQSALECSQIFTDHAWGSMHGPLSRIQNALDKHLIRFPFTEN